MFSHEIRVTIMPTTRQEAVHLRMLSPPAEILKPTELGMPETALDSIRETLTQPEGLILISGPTGAGKTMTLYSLASFLKLESLIAVSVEDPVEYDLGYVRQVQADQEHGLFMQTALRSVLRMDPDIILIGEIRDTASAVTAVRAAASGRFVLATLHARDTALALEACHYYSIPRHLLGSTLQMVISQVLVRKVCHACADQREPTSDERELFSSQGLTPPARVPVPKGCDTCHHFGYLGQTGIFEVVVFDHAMGAAISRAQGAEAIRSMLAQEDIPTLRRAALNKVAQGITTLEEINDLHFPGG
jgi:type II secretory ATPase GspE/PulE/Tfp pilus assembly ATPase PilB-like protein